MVAQYTVNANTGCAFFQMNQHLIRHEGGKLTAPRRGGSRYYWGTWGGEWIQVQQRTVRKRKRQKQRIRLTFDRSTSAEVKKILLSKSVQTTSTNFIIDCKTYNNCIITEINEVVFLKYWHRLGNRELSLTLRLLPELQLQQQHSPQEEAAEWEQHLKTWLELMLETHYLLETPGKKAKKLLFSGASHWSTKHK